MQRISELFGRNSGTTRQWIDFSKNLGPYQARARTESFCREPAVQSKSSVAPINVLGSLEMCMRGYRQSFIMSH
jgi:hypothetical protein